MKDQTIALTINGLQHVGIPVTNMIASEAFYASLGFNNVMRATFPHEGEQGICCMLKRGSIIMELYEMPKKAIAEIQDRKNGHIDHVAFDVPDIDEAFSTLKLNGYHIIEEAPVFLQFWKNGTKYFNIVGPDGERLEFNQVMP